MQVACLLIDHFPYRVEVQRRPGLWCRLVLIVHGEGSRSTVLDCAPAMAGVAPGMPLQQALSRYKHAVLLEADQPEYEAQFEDVLEALEQRSPVVEPAGLGCAYIGLDGLSQMYGGDSRLVAVMLGAVPVTYEPRLGVAGGKFPAYVAALAAGPGQAFRVTEPVAEFLAGAGVDLLPVPWPVVQRLHGFGLHTLRDVAAVGLGPLQAQFGLQGRRMWELSRGHDPSPVLPRVKKEAVTTSLTFTVATVSLEAIVTAAESLLMRLFSAATLRGRLARICTLRGRVLHAPLWEKRIVFREPVGDRARALFVAKHALVNHPPPGPLEDLEVTISGLTGEVGCQESLFSEVRRREQLNGAIAQLKASLGRNPVYQVREVEPWSRIPERRQALVTYEP
ncbi:MAG: DNA polymerase Y family protein [Dehalococcoidia bacterium]